MQVCNVLMHPKIKLLRMYFTQEYIGKYHYSELFKESFTYLDESMIIPVIKYFDIDYAIFEKKSINDMEVLLKNGEVRFNKIKETSHIALYKVGR